MVALAASSLRSQSLEPPSNTQKAYPLPEGWKVYPMPDADSLDWIRANNSNREWRVQLSNGEVLITKILPDEWEHTTSQDHLPFETKPQGGWIYTTAPPPPPPPLPPGARKSQSRRPKKWHSPVRGKDGWFRSYETKFEGARVTLRTPDGWVVGFNAGEWGGGLFWFNSDGTRHYQLKLDHPIDRWDAENVRELRSCGESVIAFQGLSHMGLDVGKVVKLSHHDDGAWKAKLLANLGSSPQVCLQDREDSWIVITSKSIHRLDITGKLEDLGKSDFTRGLYPNSITRTPDGTIYLGMRHFVARLIPDGKGFRAELLVPTNLPLFDPEPPGTPD